MGTSRVRLLSTGASTMALKPPFSSLIATPGCRGLRPSHSVTPSMVFPTHGYRGATLWMPRSGDISPWRRPTLATPALGDVLSWRRFLLAMPCPLATPCLGVTSPRQRLMLTLTSTLTLTLTLSTPGYGTVHKEKRSLRYFCLRFSLSCKIKD